MGQPTEPVQIKSLGTAANLLDGEITGVRMLGSPDPVKWQQTTGALNLEVPKPTRPHEAATVVFRIETRR